MTDRLSDISDDEPLTTSYRIYGRRITSLPFDYAITSEDLTDPGHSDGFNMRQRVECKHSSFRAFRIAQNKLISSLSRMAALYWFMTIITDQFESKLLSIEILIRGGDGPVRKKISA